MALRPLSGDYSGEIPKSVGGRLQLYYAYWRRYLELDTREKWLSHHPTVTIYRYSYQLPNKEFKRRWVKSHGTTAGLKDQPRHRLEMLDVRGKHFVHYLRRIRIFLMGLDRHKAQRVLMTRKAVRKYSAPPRVIREKKALQRARLPTMKVGLVHPDPDGEYYLRLLGGLTYSLESRTVPPPRGRDKYWYFYRLKGEWRPSEHHPYGDEAVFCRVVSRI